MKNLVIIILLLASGVALAQKGERGDRKRMKDFSPEQVATLQTKKATLALDLTEAQQTQMKALFEENAKVRKAKMEERKAQKESGEKKELSSEEKYTIANERLDQQIAQKAKMKQILSDEQMEKWSKMKKRKGKHLRGKGRSGKGNQKRK